MTVAFNMFLLIRLIFHSISLWKNQDDTFIADPDSSFATLLMIQWIVAGVGVFLCFFCSYIFVVTTTVVYYDEKENIFLFLDGNV